MLNIHRIIRRLGLMLLLAGFGVQAMAAGADIQWTPKTVKGGFTVTVPVIDNDALVDEIVAQKIELTQDEKLLSLEMEQKRFKRKDTVLAALLPGGMLYAAIKKNAHSQVVQDHERVSSRLKEITTDLAAFTAIAGPVELARVH
jgi:hypothetical protein